MGKIVFTFVEGLYGFLIQLFPVPPKAGSPPLPLDVSPSSTFIHPACLSRVMDTPDDTVKAASVKASAYDLANLNTVLLTFITKYTAFIFTAVVLLETTQRTSLPVIKL